MPEGLDACVPTRVARRHRASVSRLAAAAAAAVVLASSVAPATGFAEGPPPARAPGVLRRAASPTPPAAPIASSSHPPIAAERAARAVAPPAVRPSSTAEPVETAPVETPAPASTELVKADASALPIASGAMGAVAAGARLVLAVPGRSQFDGSPYETSNCGPTALAMVLAAYGVDVPPLSLRYRVNQLQGTSDPKDGVAIDRLAQVARQAGLRPVGLYANERYARWTVDDVRAQIRTGYPVVTLVKYRSLPYVRGSSTQSDHYIVVAGLQGQGLLVNDPAMPASDRLIPLAAEELENAWAASSVPNQAVAIAPGAGRPELQLPEPPQPTATPKAEVAITPISRAPDTPTPDPVPVVAPPADPPTTPPLPSDAGVPAAAVAPAEPPLPIPSVEAGSAVPSTDEETAAEPDNAASEPDLAASEPDLAAPEPGLVAPAPALSGWRWPTDVGTEVRRLREAPSAIGAALRLALAPVISFARGWATLQPQMEEA